MPQPPRQEVRLFHQDAEPLLEHERKWFDESMRSIIANAFAQAAKDRGYTIWACAICSNHGHVVVGTNRESAEVIWSN